jgi:hypothetical protein
MVAHLLHVRPSLAARRFTRRRKKILKKKGI